MEKKKVLVKVKKEGKFVVEIEKKIEINDVKEN
jgi:hypothetical protein